MFATRLGRCNVLRAIACATVVSTAWHGHFKLALHRPQFGVYCGSEAQAVLPKKLEPEALRTWIAH